MPHFLLPGYCPPAKTRSRPITLPFLASRAYTPADNIFAISAFSPMNNTEPAIGLAPVTVPLITVCLSCGDQIAIDDAVDGDIFPAAITSPFTVRSSTNWLAPTYTSSLTTSPAWITTLSPPPSVECVGGSGDESHQRGQGQNTENLMGS